MANFTLTAGADTMVGGAADDTVDATAATLNSGDSLTGGAGTDVLTLVGGGDFDIGRLATFTGFERIKLDNYTNSNANLRLGSQSIEVDGTGLLSIKVTSPSNWNGSNIINGANSVEFSDGAYDLTSNTFSDVKGITGSNVTLLINNATTAGFWAFLGFGANNQLATAGSTLDLSHTRVSGFAVTSTNALGTTFTVGDLGTAFQVTGGSGQDTIVSNFTFSTDQRNAIFAASSIEKIVDQTGTYTPNKGAIIQGTAGNDIIDMTHTVAGQPLPTAEEDIINGGAGNDLIFGGLGNDIIQGDVGVDTAGFTGLSRQYTFNGPNAVNGPEGFDQLTDIEILQFADGRMVYDQGDAAAIAYRMYDSAFGRAPDSLGLNGWTAALQKGLGVADMASAFAGSAEFVATYGALSNQQFVELLYHNVLGRGSDPQGLSGWTNFLSTNTMSRGQVLAGFSESNEHVQKLAPAVSAGIFDVNETAASVARLYDATFNRLPDSGGLLGWKGYVDNGMSLSAVADGFAFSAEFQNTYGNLSNEGFVERLYHNVLDRASDPAGLQGWTSALDSGQYDRGDVLLGFSESMEHQINTSSVIDHGIWFL